MKQVINKNGHPKKEIAPDEEELLKDVFGKMLYIRKLDKRSVSLQRQGEIGTYAPCKGQEAAQIGSALALHNHDWLFPSYREFGALIEHGVPPARILQYWEGNEAGSCFFPKNNCFPFAVPVGSQALHAVGAARTFDNQCAVAYFGDGATSEGEVMEALNFAGLWNVPAIFFCQNNQWAISVPRSEQTASKTLAEKADGFGCRSIRIDGNDPLTVYRTVKEERSKVINNSSPVFIEAVTYRLGNHTTSDDAGRYRSDKEVEEAQKEDPIKRTKKFLTNNSIINKKFVQKLEQWIDAMVNQCTKRFKNFDPPQTDDMFKHTYHKLPNRLRKQNKEWTNDE